MPPGTAGESAPPLSREARLPRFIAPRAEAGEALARLGVVLVGAGAVGRNIAIHLARLMLGRLWIVDSGSYKPLSLLTQAIAPADIGQSKAHNTAELCKRISPTTRVYAFAGPVEVLDAVATAGADLVVLATDNLLAEVLVGQRCLNLGQPLVQASVHGDTLTAQVRFFGNQGGESPCPACSFNESEWAALNAQTSYSCEPGSGAATVARASAAPTMSVGFLCSLAADLALVQILRFAVGLGSNATDALVDYCGYTQRIAETPLVKRPDCPAAHTAWTRLEPPRPLPDCSLRDLVAAAGLRPRSRARQTATFMVDELSYAERAICAVGHRTAIGRFVRHGRIETRCYVCGGALTVEPFYSHRPATTAVLAPAFDRPLRDLADGPCRWVVLRAGEHGFLFRSPMPSGSGGKGSEA